MDMDMDMDINISTMVNDKWFTELDNDYGWIMIMASYCHLI